MFLVVLEWKTPWSVEQQVLEATTVEAARELAGRYKRPGIRVRIFELSRELAVEAPAATPEPAPASESQPTEPAMLAETTKTG